ncbi:MAG: adenylate/guanylate cyclase domain-containing protein [PVC group bacterium]
MSGKNFNKQRKKIGRGILIGFLASILALLFWHLGLLDRWESASWAWRVRYFARPSPTTEQVKIILLDQASLDWGEKEMGLSWPWPREVYGPIIDFCRRGGARSVAFDVLYTESSDRQSVSQDVALGEAIRRSPPFTAALSLSKMTGGESAWPPDLPPRGIPLEGLSSWLSTPEREKSLVYPRATFPIPEVGLNAVLLGNVTEEPDPDAIFRRSALFGVFDNHCIPALGTAAYLAPLHAEAVPLSIGGTTLHLGEKSVPLDASGRALLRFRGDTAVYRPLSAAAVIQSELRIQEGAEPSIDPATFRDCYVFFGFSAPGLHDLRATPLSPKSPGVLVHATVLDNLLSGDFLQDAPALPAAGLIVLLAIAAGSAVSLARKAGESAVISALCLPFPWVLGFAAYPAGCWWPIIAGEAAVVLSLAGALLYNYATEGRQKAFIKGAFKYYLSPAVIERLIEDPSQLALGGERKVLTIFFSDIQKFSTFSEKLDPPTLTALLNDFLSDMTDIILEEGGTLDKYIGDAIVAFWNAPLAQNDHAERTVRAALHCQKKLAARRADFRERVGVDLFMRIGLNTGEVVVGNMGSRDRFDYTVLGDAANLASRLEGANKAFGTYLMVSEATWEQTAGAFTGRELGKLRVVGRKTPVTVFQPWGSREEEPPPGWKAFAQGVAMCYQGRWKEALALFKELPEDPAARVYAERCEALINDPGKTWDGVWNLTEK